MKRESSYYVVHQWLIKTYRKAVKCEEPNCLKKSKVYEWALIKGKKYEKKRKNFWQLCRSCHFKYDFTEKWRNNMSQSHMGYKQSAEQIKKRMKGVIGHTVTPEVRARISTNLKRYWQTKPLKQQLRRLRNE